MPGDPAVLIIGLSVALLCLVLGAAGWVLILHWRNQRDLRLCNKLANLWRPDLLNYLAGASISDSLQDAAQHHPAYFVNFLSRQAPLISGLVQERLKSLLTSTAAEKYLRTELRADKYWRAAQAARVVALFEHPGFEAELRSLLPHRSAAVVFAAAYALARTGTGDVLPLLLKTMTAFSGTNQDLVELVLLAYGEKHPSDLVSFIEANTVADENLYVVLLEVLGVFHVQSASRLLRAEVLSPRTPESLLKALRAIGQIKAVSARDAVTSVARSDTWQARAVAAWSLGQLRDKRDIPVLRRSLEDYHWSVRLNAANALAAMDESGFAALEEAATHSEDRFAVDMARHVLGLHKLAIASR